jgi:hypothetical protein
MPTIVAKTHPDDLDPEELTFVQLDELSAITREDATADDLESTASDIVNKARSTNGASKADSNPENLEDDISAH